MIILLRIAIAALVLAPGAACAFPQDAERGLDPERVHALIVGVLEWQSPSLASFPSRDRQDRLFAETLIARGVPAKQVSVLLDEEATLAAIETELTRVAKRAGPGSTLILYYAGHGVRRDGRCYFANYDMKGDVRLGLDGVATLLHEHFEGDRFLAFADCCHSGSLSTVVDRLAEKGVRAGCVTSVVPESTSTGNWTFTQTLVEAFSGDPSLDDDGDGFVELGELDDAVSDAMAYRESQRSGHHVRRLDGSLRLVATTPSRTADLGKSDLVPGQHVHVRHGRRERLGRVVGRDGEGAHLVRLYAYATHRDVPYPRTSLFPIESPTLAVGTTVGIRRGPDVLAARVDRVDGPFHLVSFPRWPELEGEWRLADRLADPPKDERRSCMVLWEGTWYPAVVLREREKRYEIHYVGYGADWDEEVGTDRIRFPVEGRPPRPRAN